MIIPLHRIRITQTEHLKEVPHVTCKDYSTGSFGNCLEKEVQNTCLSILACVPFWFTDERGKTCDRNFNNLSISKQISLGAFLADIHVDNVEAFSCQIPCKSVTVDAEMVMEDNAVSENYISIRMNQKKETIKTRLSFDFLHGFLPAIGGDLGLTRNLLWLSIAFMALLKISRGWMSRRKKLET